MNENNDLEKIYLEAAEIVKKLPEHLQAMAFNRAVDELRGYATPSKKTSRKNRINDTIDIDSGLVEVIDRTKYPEVARYHRVADRALRILQIANADHNIDGLTATEISDILTQKFRLPVSSNAINMALERETQTVNIKRGSHGKKMYHLMVSGEEHLAQLSSGNTPTIVQIHRKTPKKKLVSKRSNNETETKTEKSKKTPNAPKERKIKSRPGPKLAIQQLIASGFFASPKTISDAQKELRDRRGHSYSVQDLAPALVRSVRDASLNRRRNSEGQYEYSIQSNNS